MRYLVTGEFIDPGPSSCLYSAECVEGQSCELRLEGRSRKSRDTPSSSPYGDAEVL